jgi:hypothetical protein
VCIIIFVSFANGMQSMVYTAIPYLFEHQRHSSSANILFAAVVAGFAMACVFMVFEMTVSHRRSKDETGTVQTKGQLLSIVRSIRQVESLLLTWCRYSVYWSSQQAS